jgi:SAM-dependent methyltransferase
MPKNTKTTEEAAKVMKLCKTRYASVLGTIQLRYKKNTGTLTYVQRGGNQTAVDKNGVSLDTYIHALYGLIMQKTIKTVLMIGCGGGTLGKMLARDGKKVTIVDIDKASFKLARTHFGLPADVACHAGDGLAFMQRSRRRYDVLIIDAFIGEKIPPQFTDYSFCRAARRCLKLTGGLFMNVCINDKADLIADTIAHRLKHSGWTVRLLDQRGTARNAIVLGGDVKGIKKPRLRHVPQTEASRIKRELSGMRFRSLKRLK